MPKNEHELADDLVMPVMALKEVATAVRVDVQTVRRWTKSGKLPSVKIAGKICVPREAVLKAQREGI